MAEDRNVDDAELDRFERLAHRWWDPAGEFRPLHALNPVRTAFVADRHALGGARVLDVGCGGGLLAEALSALGAKVVGIDAGRTAIAVARLHARANGLDIVYEQHTVERHVETVAAGSYDCITCMEVLEHLPDPERALAACGTLLRKGGDAFFSTINRSPKSYLFAVLGAEYLLRLLPRGTHDYARFLKPSELTAFAARAGLVVQTLRGFGMNPITQRFSLSRDVSVNYIAHARRP